MAIKGSKCPQYIFSCSIHSTHFQINPGNKSKAIFRAHASPGALSTLSQRARIFSQEVRWDKENMDQSAVSQGNEVKLDGSVSGESRR